MQSNETILYVNLKKLEDNFNFLKSKLPKSTKIIAVVKAYAYGMGDERITKKLIDLGAEMLWVADFEEGIRLRKKGINHPIVVANPGLKSLNEMIEHDLEPVIFNDHLLNLYINANRPINIHLKFNTGMNRFGFEANEVDNVIKTIQKNNHLKLNTVCSHLACSNDESKDDFTLSQINCFRAISHKVNAILDKDIPTHLFNSTAVLRFKSQENYVRLGIGLFEGSTDENLKQIFEFKSTISQVKHIKKGARVGYNSSFIAKQDMTIGIVAVGYADGLNRKLGNGNGSVLINKQSCSIIGEISMDSFITDISNLDVEVGQEVELFSRNLSVSDLAKKSGTISYELMATLNHRIKRVYIE